MSASHLKTPYPLSANSFARRKVLNAAQLTGKSLPATVTAVDGAFVTVSFTVDASPWTLPSIQVPLTGSEYLRVPVQPGCRGVVRPSDVSLGHVTGAVSAPPSLGGPSGNLSSLVFEPIGTQSYQPVPAGKAVMYGEPGALVMSKDGSASVDVEPGVVTMTAGGHTVILSAAGLSIDGVLFAAHEHTGVSSGSALTGPVAP